MCCRWTAPRSGAQRWSAPGSLVMTLVSSSQPTSASSLSIRAVRSAQRAREVSSAPTSRRSSLSSLASAPPSLSSRRSTMPPGIDLDAFHLALNGPPSPLKASKLAGQHIMNKARRIPLHSMLDKLEETVSRLTASPEKQLKPLPLGKRGSSLGPRGISNGGSTGFSLSARSANSSRSSLPDGCSRSARGTISFTASAHIQKHVVELYETFHARQEVETARRAAAELTVGTKEDRDKAMKSARLPEAGSFVDVLKLYYPSFSHATLEMMVRDAKEGLDAVDRRKFVLRAKGSYADRLRLAFEKADKDGSGGLSADEFIAATQRCGTQPPGHSKSHPVSKQQIKDIFVAADTDGNGVLDMDEFLELCAHQPWLVAAFDRIVEAGVKNKMRNEEARLTSLFRTPVSPLSRLVMSPSGHRRRPSLVHVRPTFEVPSPEPQTHSYASEPACDLD